MMFFINQKTAYERRISDWSSDVCSSDLMTVVESIMLGAESGAILAVSVEKARAELRRLARDYSLEVDPDALAGELPVGQQQRVEILKALYRGADILIQIGRAHV